MPRGEAFRSPAQQLGLWKSLLRWLEHRWVGTRLLGFIIIMDLELQLNLPREARLLSA